MSVHILTGRLYVNINRLADPSYKSQQPVKYSQRVGRAAGDEQIHMHNIRCPVMLLGMIHVGAA